MTDFNEEELSPSEKLEHLARWARSPKNLSQLEAWYANLEKKNNDEKAFKPSPYLEPEPYLRGKVTDLNKLSLTQADKEFFRQCGIETP